MPPRLRLASVSVDLDEVDCYASIYGLPDVPREAAHAIYDKALPRLSSCFDALAVRATFFAIGRDLTRMENADRLRTLHRKGHEIANHSANHFYDLTRRPADDLYREIAEGTRRIAEAVGQAPRGFRAPGYTVTDTVFDALQSLDYVYDSSVFPCPSYYLAKVAAISALRAMGRPTHSIVDDPRMLTAPADPYRTGRPYWHVGRGMIELPIGVTRGASGRLPFIGTSLVLAGEAGSRWLTRRILGRPFVNLELHGIDAADADADGLSFLRSHQQDLRRPLQVKIAALTAAITTLRDAGYRFVPLAEAAAQLADTLDT